MKEKTICRGDLFYYDFGTRTGSVQSGTRPVLVIQADDYNRNAPTIIVAAVTGVIKSEGNGRYQEKTPAVTYPARSGVWTQEAVNGSTGATSDSKQR